MGAAGSTDTSKFDERVPGPAGGPPCNMYGAEDIPAELVGLAERISLLPAMAKRAMSGRCHQETLRMELFMQSNFGFRNPPGEYFVDGVKAFVLDKPVSKFKDEEELVFQDFDAGKTTFTMTAKEIREWQETYRCFVPHDVYEGKAGLDLLKRSLEGFSVAGDEAWRMKFVVRIAKTPIYSTFDAQILQREANAKREHLLHLVSVSGIDFAGRKHDVKDITHYISNWREVYELNSSGMPVVWGGRDFCPTGVAAKVNTKRLEEDLYRMASVRLKAVDLLGVQVAVETGIGLGVFSGDDIGVGPIVRTASANALRKVLETEKFTNLKAVLCAMPIFRRGGPDNFDYFARAFKGYKGAITVVVADQDMHALALASANEGFVTSELNPADSHGVFGEYWQNRGPAVEEKLALTTGGLLTQHHAANPRVLDTDSYVGLDLSKQGADCVVFGNPLGGSKTKKAEEATVAEPPAAAAATAAAATASEGAGAGAGAGEAATATPPTEAPAAVAAEAAPEAEAEAEAEAAPAAAEPAPSSAAAPAAPTEAAPATATE